MSASAAPRSVGKLTCIHKKFENGVYTALFEFDGADISGSGFTDSDVALSVMLEAEKQFKSHAARDGFLNINERQIRRDAIKGNRPKTLRILMEAVVGPGAKPLSIRTH